VAEVYPALWMRRFERDDRDDDEQAAYAVAAWLQRADQNCSLGSYWNPPLTPEEREVAAIEGWIGHNSHTIVGFTFVVHPVQIIMEGWTVNNILLRLYIKF
jgi:hypothetical protein